MFSYFQARKEEIVEYLKVLLDEKADELSRVNPLGRDLCDRLYSFAVGGKMIRGGLVSLGCSIVNGGECTQELRQLTTAAGTAMELFQSGLLAHDDIMDRDMARRGLKSLFYQYVELAENGAASDAYHLGEALGICAGDVAYFLAFEILGRLAVPPPAYGEIVSLTARELGYVGVAQMQDIYAGGTPTAVADEEVMRLYLYKTGRYTFSLPLMIGALLGGGEPQSVASLERLGENLGLVFQIKDDEIGLFGDAAETGKPVGSDVKEGKKTLYYGYLQRRAAAEEIKRLRGIYGNPAAEESEVQYVRELTERLGVRREIQERVEALGESARSLVDLLAGPGHSAREVLLGLLDYSLARTR